MTKGKVYRCKKVAVKDVIDLIEYGVNSRKGETIGAQPYSESFPYFKKLIESDNYIAYKKSKKVIAFASYYKLKDLIDVEEVRRMDDTWNMPANISDGKIVFVDTLISDGQMNGTFIKRFIRDLKKKEQEALYAVWIGMDSKMYLYNRRKKSHAE